MNPILQLLGQTSPAMQTINSILQTVRAAADPQEAISQMAQSDPRMQQVMQVVRQNGGDAKSAFYNLARQRGVDPESILNQLRGMGL